jgi:hypothetical protein
MYQASFFFSAGWLKHLVCASLAVDSISAVSWMADSQQGLLRSAWLVGKAGCLPGREQAKAWALREVWREADKADYGMHSSIAAKLTKTGGGVPSNDAVRKFFEKVDDDADWFPGKGNYENMGRQTVMTGQQRAAIARCAMIMKKAGLEPTYPRIIARGGARPLRSTAKLWGQSELLRTGLDREIKSEFRS